MRPLPAPRSAADDPLTVAIAAILRAAALLPLLALLACAEDLRSPAVDPIDDPDAADEPDGNATDDAGEPDAADQPDALDDQDAADEPDAADQPDVADEPDALEGQPEPEPPEPEPAPPEPEAPIYDCDSFALSEVEHFSLPLRTVRIEANGGSGLYTFALADNPDGASVNPDTGIFLAGAAEDRDYAVEVIDTGCALSLTASVRVVRRATVAPSQPTIPTGQLLCFSVEGGSGPQDGADSPFLWEIVRGNEGDSASISDDGCYLSGRRAGVDILQITDTRTGQILQVAVIVTDGPVEISATLPALAIPVGESFSFGVSGGTGAFLFEILAPNGTGSALDVDPDEQGAAFVAGPRAGKGQIAVRDAFLADVVTLIPFEVMASSFHPATAYGAHTDDSDLAGVGDVNGDGFPDAVLALRNGGINGQFSGSAFLYLGGQPTAQGLGLGAEPAQILVGNQRFNSLGRSIASGDFDNDGCRDVAIGVYGERLGLTNVGEVRVFKGCHDGPDAAQIDFNGRLLDNPLPPRQTVPMNLWRRLPGQSNNDFFGWAMAAGDFDNDGLDDLAVSAYRAEATARVNPQTGTPFTDIGRVYIYLNRQGAGLPEQPDLFIDGVAIGEDGRVFTENTFNFGARIAAADVNGDGCDDLLVGAEFAQANHGFASLYTSIQDGGRPGGCVLSTSPALTVWPATEERRRASRMGNEVGFGDFNGDCVPDLVVAQFTAAELAGGNTAAGALNVFFGDPSWSPLTPIALLKTGADLVIEGEANDQLGSSFGVGDVDGDGIDDIIVGVRLGEQPSTVADVGEVRVYKGLVSPEGCGGVEQGPFLSAPTLVVNEPAGNGDFFGQRVAVLGDVDDDGVGDWAVLASRGALNPDDVDDHLGRLYWQSGAEPAPSFDTLQTVEHVVNQNDDQYGARVAAVGDLNADGFNDFAAAAPLYDMTRDLGTYVQPNGSAGAVFLYLGGPEGVGAEPDAIFARHALHSGSDQFGFTLVGAGDYDGDGFGDIAIAAPFEDNAGPCAACRAGGPFLSDTGAIFVYRGGPAFDRGQRDPSGLIELNAPDFTLCGPQIASVQAGRELAGGFDIDDDGFDDLIFSNWNYNGQRGIAWSGRGRAFPGQAAVICVAEADRVGEGSNVSDLVGHGVAGADLNGDGCDDLIASGYNSDDPAAANSGVLRVRLGRGGVGCPVDPVIIDIYGERAGDNIGFRVAAIGDMNGDGVGDLAVSSSGFGTTNEGVVLILGGAELQGDLAGLTSNATMSLDPAHVIGRIIDPEGVANTNFGYALESIGDVNGDGLPDLLVGSRLSSLSGTLRSGAAYLYLGSREPDALSRPDLVIAGQRLFSDSNFANSVAGGALRADRSGGAAVLLIGAPFAERDGAAFGEVGAVFIANPDLD